METKTQVLNYQVEMPVLGYGVFQLEDLDECEKCVVDAIRFGYRLIDTAAAYLNEEAVGNACSKVITYGIVKREDLFITTKVWIQDYTGCNTIESVNRSLEKLKMDYIDLVLLHQPFGDWQNAWRQLEQLYDEGVVRAIGVSNFNERMIDKLLSFCRVKPVVNQVEFHPFFSQDSLLRKLKKYEIQLESWGSLSEGLRDIFENSILVDIARKHKRTVAQVAIRWNLQRGNVVLTGSKEKEHIQENL